MSRGDITKPFKAWDRWWLSTSDEMRSRVQFCALTIVCLVGYHYSLSSLVANLGLSTPLAYIGLVPVIALAAAAVRGRVGDTGPPIYDRQLDWIVGLPLIAGAMVITFFVPSKVSAMYWVWRLDLISLPLYVAGTVALLFGTRTLWRQKFAVAYLVLAWPYPYMLVLLSVLNGFTSFTLKALRALVGVVHVATPLPGGDGSLFQVAHRGVNFPLSVVSACSGVDSVVGFLLVGTAFAAVVKGHRVVKAVWLIFGMLLLWAINVGRILFIFWAGQQWGEHIALDILHPFIGLVTFSIGIVLMILVMPLLHLRMWQPNVHLRPAESPREKPPVPSIMPALALLAVVAVVMGVNNTGLRSYNLVANAAGEAKLASYSLNPGAPNGWTVNYQTEFTWAKPYFGDDSTWLRYQYDRQGSAFGVSTSPQVVTADVIDTGDLNSFSAFSVEDCYDFHGYKIRDLATVKLTGGIEGQALSYTTGRDLTWSIVYWIMPVRKTANSSTRYERVILYVQDLPGVALNGSASDLEGVRNLDGSLNPRNSNDRRLIAERGFLAHFAREVINAQSHIQIGTRLVSSETTSPGSGAVQTQTESAAPFVKLFNGNILLARYYTALTPRQRVTWRARNPQSFAGG